MESRLISKLESAALDARRADHSDTVDDISYYGGRARKKLESIDLSKLEPSIASIIRKAIREAKNADYADDVDDGQYYGARAYKSIQKALSQLK